VEVKVETHLVGTHRVFSISDIFMFSRIWQTWYHHDTFEKTRSVRCQQKRSYGRLKSASFWWWKKSRCFWTKLFSGL